MKVDWFIVTFAITAVLVILACAGVRKTKSVTFCYIVTIIAVVILLVIDKL